MNGNGTTSPSVTPGGRGLGWRPDLPDYHDYQYAAKPTTIRDLPAIVDLESHCPMQRDQGPLGSCTGNGICSQVEFALIRQGVNAGILLSRLFVYFGEREREGTIAWDAGAMPRDGMKVIKKLGVPREELWPYQVSTFRDRPVQAAYDDALNHQVLIYRKVPQTLVQLKACLAEGFPFGLGFTVYESFESAQVERDGIVPMPGSRERVLGGHYVYVIGYNDVTGRFTCRNSWGGDWGDHGNFYLPYHYVMSRDLAGDTWTVRLVEQ